jgi:hypothetical protein
MTTAMRRAIRRFLAAIGLTLLAAVTLAAQELECNGYKNGIANISFGGYTVLAHLDPTATTDFRTGYSLGASLGVQLTDYVGVHADFTFARAEARGTAPFAGTFFDRFFYGAHVELKQATSSPLAPYAFAGGGAVTVMQTGHEATMATFTRPAAMFGVGLFFQAPRSTFEMFLEGKGLVYAWAEPGYRETQWDVTYAVGLTHRFRL